MQHLPRFSMIVPLILVVAMEAACSQHTTNMGQQAGSTTVQRPHFRTANMPVQTDSPSVGMAKELEPPYIAALSRDEGGEGVPNWAGYVPTGRKEHRDDRLTIGTQILIEP